MKVQNNNRKNNRYIIYKNKKYTIGKLSSELNINYRTLLDRINKNWNEDELGIKPNKHNRR